MQTQYNRTGSALKPFVIPDDILRDMGRLVRAFAELEDIINLHMCHVAQISEGQAMILLGRSGISQKIAWAQTFADAMGGKVAQMTKAQLDNEAFRAMQTCRNAVAHGVLLGMTERGHIAFRTVTAVDMDLTSNRVGVEVLTYVPKSIGDFADMAELATHEIEAAFEVAEQRATRRAQPLASHPKARSTRSPSAKPMRQRKPPRGKRGK